MCLILFYYLYRDYITFSSSSNLISQVKQLKADSEAEDNKENRKILCKLLLCCCFLLLLQLCFLLFIFSDYKKTALAPFIENFEDFINNLTTEKKET